jgi:hypothetical protein
MSKGSSIYLWSVNVPMDQFPDAEAAQAAVVGAVAGVKGTVLCNTAGGMYVVVLPSTVGDGVQVRSQLQTAGIQSRVRLLRSSRV